MKLLKRLDKELRKRNRVIYSKLFKNNKYTFFLSMCISILAGVLANKLALLAAMLTPLVIGAYLSELARNVVWGVLYLPLLFTIYYKFLYEALTYKPRKEEIISKTVLKKLNIFGGEK